MQVSIFLTFNVSFIWAWIIIASKAWLCGDLLGHMMSKPPKGCKYSCQCSRAVRGLWCEIVFCIYFVLSDSIASQVLVST